MDIFFRIEQVEAKLDVLFQQKELLKQAFVHRSFWNENQQLVSEHNERLEFLGDSVLGLVVGEYLFLRHPKLDEGALSMLRSQLVDAQACAQYVLKLGLEEFLLLGKGERENRGKGRDSILADLFEAIIGAFYIDQGLEAVRKFFFSHFIDDVDRLIEKPLHNWKAELQDYAQKKFQQAPIYEVIEESGPAHRKTFRVQVLINGVILAEGEGSSKKEAQVIAAKNALSNIPEDSR